MLARWSTARRGRGRDGAAPGRDRPPRVPAISLAQQQLGRGADHVDLVEAARQPGGWEQDVTDPAAPATGPTQPGQPDPAVAGPSPPRLRPPPWVQHSKATR